MEASPLTQQARPSFQPKISQLYGELFVDEADSTHPEGFWREFFLLKPDRASFQRRLEHVSPDELLHFQYESQQLFAYAIQSMAAGKAPSDEVALDTLTVFLCGVLVKRFTNPSADIITVLAGLDEVDAVFSEFANTVERIIRTGRSLDIRKKAVEVALALTSGAYQTSLVSYFTHRDLFPALMKYVQDSEHDNRAFEPFLLLGLLSNYHRFEYRNPYRLRLEDFVSESTIQKIIRGLGDACAASRTKYVAMQEDLAEGWNISNTLTYIGLGVLAPVKAISPTSAKEDSKEAFAGLPGAEAAVLLAAYDFTSANKLFCSNLVSSPAEVQQHEATLSSFLSLTSYILHHAYRSPRAGLYGLLNLLTLRILIEDQVICKRICSDESKLPVRLCRQRQPYLPAVGGARPAAAHILDIACDMINHNLHRRLDIDLYIACVNLIHRLLCCISQTKMRLTYHWSFLWQTLLALLRFLTTYASDLSNQSLDIHTLISPLIRTIALAVSAGNAFLTDPTAYDDLVYKLVESGDFLARFKVAYKMGPSSSESANAIDILINVSRHYRTILEAERGKGRMSKNLSPREMSKVIRQGYETLDVPAMEGLDSWQRYREADERGVLKRAARLAVEDTRRLLGDI